MDTYSSEIDEFLADAGYWVQPDRLCHVAAQLEALDAAMLTEDSWSPPDLAHCNPSDLVAWVDAMLNPGPRPVQSQTTSTWLTHVCPRHIPVASEDDVAIQLVRQLMASADSIQHGDLGLASCQLDEINLLLTHLSRGHGIGKVAGYFADALCRRLLGGPSTLSMEESSAADEDLYQGFYEATPYLKFAHFTANNAILDAINGCRRVHIVDLGLSQGLQWPALIQALSLRRDGAPLLRLTGIGLNSPDSLKETGLKLSELARAVGVPFSFRGIAVNTLDELKPPLLHVVDGEAVVINSALQLHRVVPEPGSSGPIDSVLDWIVGLRPKIVIVVEQESDHNEPVFLDRFTEALFYYTAMFESVEGGKAAGKEAVEAAEMYLQREIRNILCCEGLDRVERHEPMVRWKARLGRAGLSPVGLGLNAFVHANSLVALFSGEGFCVDEAEGCLSLGWHNRPLIWTSAWRLASLPVN